jgi:hypothetical protein
LVLGGVEVRHIKRRLLVYNPGIRQANPLKSFNKRLKFGVSEPNGTQSGPMLSAATDPNGTQKGTRGFEHTAVVSLAAARPFTRNYLKPGGRGSVEKGPGTPKGTQIPPH